MSARSGGSIQCWLLLLLLPTLLLAQDDCSHNYKNEANRYYYVRPEGSVETLCPAQHCLTPSQLREHFSECERNNSCQNANTSLVLLPGTYTLASNRGSFIPQLEFLSLTGCNEDCNTDSLATPSIDCNGTSISLMFQHINCVNVRNCVVFTGHDTNVAVDHVTFHDSLIRLASITDADHSELDYNYTLGSQSYCLLQKQLADINVLTPSRSVLALRNVSFSSEYHTACARDNGIQLTTIRATDSALDIADCLFTQNAVTHISLLHSSLNTSGMVQFEYANTAILVNSSTVTLAGVVNFVNNNNSAIQALDSIIVLAGTVEFTNNTSVKGGAISMMMADITIADNARVIFQGNHAINGGGAIHSLQHVTIAGSVQFINNSADYVGGAIASHQLVTIAGSVQFINNSADSDGGAIASNGNVTIADNAQDVVFQGNHAVYNSGGAITSGQHVTIAGSVQFINNSADIGGAIASVDVTITDNAQDVVFQGNHAREAGGAIYSDQHVTIAGSVQFINNSADILIGGAIASVDVTITDNAQDVVFQGNHAREAGGAIYSDQHVTIAGSVQFINNSADNGGAIHSRQHVTIAGSVQFINNSADIGGAIASNGNVTIADNAQDVVFQGNHAIYNSGGAILSGQHVTIAGSVKFINNSADIGGAIASVDVTITDNAQDVVFQGNHAREAGGAIYSDQHVTIAGSVQFINNSADNGGAIHSRQHVTIAGSVQFINNSADIGGAIASNGNVTIADNAQDVVFQGNHAIYNSGGAILSGQHVTIAGSVKFISNSAGIGGAIASSQHVTIAGSVQFINNSADYGGGAIHSDGNVTITDNAQDVVFQGNHARYIGGAISSHQHVTIAGSVQFINNSADIEGGAIDSSGGNVTISDNARVVFESNRADYGGAIASNGVIINATQVYFQGNQAESAGGAIVVLSNVKLAGSVQFFNNTALLGGAIVMIQGPLTVANNARVIFGGNRAHHVGGAIYSTTSSIVYSVQRNQPCSISFGFNTTLSFLNNTAKRGGSAMYGIIMSKLVCGTATLYDNYYIFIYEYLFDIITISPDNFSAVSSDPLRVCICPDQSTPDCLAILPEQNTRLHHTVYPGQNFTIPAAVVGFNFALTSGSVYAQFLSSDASLGSESQYVQGVNHNGCSQLQYSVLSDKENETLVLTADGRQVTAIDSSIGEGIGIQNNNSILDQLKLYLYPNPNKYYVNHTFMTNSTDGVFRLAGYVEGSLRNTPVYVLVKLRDCPLGFALTDQQRCDCDERIRTNLLSCNISDQTVHRHGNIWVNASFNGNTSNGVIVHKHCPFGYCKPEQLDVNLTHPDIQCAFNHSGTLCGACKPDFSLALGGSQCLPKSKCSNKYLLLLIAFILAGFALVFFIKILNLTVSQGTINGLIFYANIVAANRSIFFPTQHNNFVSFLFVFISWLNLDLGIETCFVKGLDGYGKTWLQFVFPFYVWAIAGAIILVSHYSIRATKIFGEKSVSVLATLLLLSYAKLLRSIIIIFSFTTIEHPDNHTDRVWSYDGNITYLVSKHIPLFVFALAIVLLLWLPYTAVLLSAQWLRTQTHRKGLRWLKPFLDAYYGPFKDKHHYWVGVLLVVRGVLFVFFAYFFAIEDNVNLLLTIVSSISLLALTGISAYKRVYVSILENSFALNLGVLAAGTFYIRHVVQDSSQDSSQEALVATSVGFAFLKFCGIITLHSYKFVIIPIQKWCVQVRANDRCIDNAVQLQPLLNPDSSSDDDSLEYMPRNEVTHSEIRLSQIREVEQDPPNPTTSAEHQLPPADRINTTHSYEILIPFNRDTPLTKSHQTNDSDKVGANRQVKFNENTTEILIPFTRDTPVSVPNSRPAKLTDAAADEAAGAPSQSEAAAVSLDQPPPPPPPPPQESSEPPRYFAAEREERFIDFNAPRETLLEYTQCRLPQERNEPARDSTAERELLSAPHEHPQESSEPRYFAAEREGPIDFTAPRESLLDYTQ